MRAHMTALQTQIPSVQVNSERITMRVDDTVGLSKLSRPRQTS